MKIGIDISQTMYQNTGVGKYLLHLVETLVTLDGKNEYLLFFSSLRKNIPKEILNLQSSTVTIKTFRFPPSLLHIIWNILHIFPIEQFIGDVDIFITSDWTEPPTRTAKKATIIYDLIIYQYPKETAKKIILVQKRKLKWVKIESDVIFCISESTRKDVSEILGITKDKLKVIYPGI